MNLRSTDAKNETKQNESEVKTAPENKKPTTETKTQTDKKAINDENTNRHNSGYVCEGQHSSELSGNKKDQHSCWS